MNDDTKPKFDMVGARDGVGARRWASGRRGRRGGGGGAAEVAGLGWWRSDSGRDAIVIEWTQLSKRREPGKAGWRRQVAGRANGRAAAAADRQRHGAEIQTEVREDLLEG